MRRTICISVRIDVPAGLIGSPSGAVQVLGSSRIDVSRIGPHLREVVPDDNRTDPNEVTWTRDAIMGFNGAVLVFTRPAG